MIFQKTFGTGFGLFVRLAICMASIVADGFKSSMTHLCHRRSPAEVEP